MMPAGHLLQTGYGGFMSGPVSGGKAWEFGYGENVPKDIVNWELQARPFERVALTGIRLQGRARP
jgi:hypothetical protein